MGAVAAAVRAAGFRQMAFFGYRFMSIIHFEKLVAA